MKRISCKHTTSRVPWHALLLTMLSSGVLLMSAPAALAQSPTATGYGETAALPANPTTGSGSASDETGTRSDTSQVAPVGPVAAPAARATLPFTGADVGLMALGALLLLAVGLLLRVRTRAASD